jgi:hypothetical protein
MRAKNKTQQEIWLDKAINKIGCANQLAKKLKCNRCNISHWKKMAPTLKPHEDLMTQQYGILIQKVTKIKGIADKLCPSIKKVKKL